MNESGVHQSTFSTRLRGLWPLGPIFTKELRQMARRRRSYLLRFLYLGILLGILSLTWYANSESYRYQSESIVEQAQKQASLGQFFFIAFSMFSVIAMQLIGPVLTSTAIGSERLKRTLDVLLMTPISSWQIVTGKLFSRLLTALVLLGLTLPVLAIVRLLGGVELTNMFGVLALSACAAMSTAALGLLISCWLKRAWAVILLSYMILAVFHAILPMIGVMFLEGIFRYSSGSGLRLLYDALFAGNPTVITVINLAPGLPLYVSWTTGCVIQLIIAATLTLLAANVVRRISKRESAGESVTPVPLTPAQIITQVQSFEKVITDKTTAYQLNQFIRPRFTGNYPILQHELSRPMFSKIWQRTTVTTITLGLLLLSYLGIASNPSMMNDIYVQIAYGYIFFTLFTLTNIVLSSTAIANEKESDTWTLLIVSPVSGHQVLWGKYIGILRRFAWPTLLIVLHFGIFAIFGVISIYSALLILWITITFNTLWLATGIYFSLRSTKVTMAVVLNLMLVISMYAAAPIVMSVTNVRSQSVFDMSKLCVYWQPYWYLAEGFFSDRQMYTSRFTLPMFGDQVKQYYILILALIAGLMHILLTLLIMFYTSNRFDRMVGRAKSHS